MRTSKHQIPVFLFLTLISGLVVGSCSPRHNSRDLAPATEKAPVPAESTKDPEIPASTVAIRNYQQLYHTMAAVTGVDPKDPTLLAYFNETMTRLSTDGNPEKLSPPMLLSTTALASLYCEKFIAIEASTAASQRKAHQSVDFLKDQSAFTPEVRNSVIQAYALLFWRRSLNDDERSALIEALNAALEGQAPSPAEVSKALLVACSATLSALEVIKI